jgi:hypothetical protein
VVGYERRELCLLPFPILLPLISLVFLLTFLPLPLLAGLSALRRLFVGFLIAIWTILLGFILFHIRLLDFCSVKFDEERSWPFASFKAAAYESCRHTICFRRFDEGTRTLVLASNGYGTPPEELETPIQEVCPAATTSS